MKLISRTEAQQKGLLRYFTGKPCAYGHIDERRVPDRKCMTCWRPQRAAGVKRWKSKNKEAVRAAGRAYWAEAKAFVTKELGGKCECCGEAELAFLVIDHRHGGGSQHRKELGGNSRVLLWIRKQIRTLGVRVVKKDFRILCFNCNQAFASLGYCPHKRVKS